MDKLLCEDCSKKRQKQWKCAACSEQKTTEFFDADVLAHARWNGRRLVCRACQEEGFSPKDCEAYRCGLCRPRGHLKFEAQSLKDAKRPERKSKLVCVDCLQVYRTAEKKYRAALKHHDAWKCSCVGVVRIHSHEKCKLYPVQAGRKIARRKL